MNDIKVEARSSPIVDRAGNQAAHAIIDVRTLVKHFAVSDERQLGAWTQSSGMGLWLRNARRKLTAAKGRDVIALKGIDLQIRRGEIFGLLGQNGAGKTTLVKILAGLIAPTSGDALVNGVSVRRNPQVVKRSVSYGSTTGWMGLEWQLSVRENLRLYAGLFGLGSRTATERVERTLCDVGLSEQAERGVHQLSHGMRQRLVLARGLLVHTPLAFLDEPTVGLDPVTAADMRRLIKETLHSERGQTVLLTGHYIPEIEMLCDRVAVLHQGQILAIGTPAELKATVSGRRVITLRVAAWQDETQGDLGALPGVLTVSLVSLDQSAEVATLRVHAEAGRPDLQDLLEVIRRRSGQVVFASTDAPTYLWLAAIRAALLPSDPPLATDLLVLTVFALVTPILGVRLFARAIREAEAEGGVGVVV